MGLSLDALLYLVPALVIAVTVHEFAHARTALAMGDPTAQAAGRVSLNPIRHLDPLGTIMLVVAHFGWGKPVPIDARLFRNARQGTFLVSLAGPAANMVTAAGLAVVSRFVPLFVPDGGVAVGILSFLTYAIYLNIVLAVFNLLPVPPLDGSKIVASVLPRPWLRSYLSLERYGIVILFLALAFFRPVVAKIMDPVLSFFARILT